jgi:hypothetical protein
VTKRYVERALGNSHTVNAMSQLTSTGFDIFGPVRPANTFSPVSTMIDERTCRVKSMRQTKRADQICDKHDAPHSQLRRDS